MACRFAAGCYKPTCVRVRCTSARFTRCAGVAIDETRTLVVGEQEGGVLKAASFSAIAAGVAFNKGKTVSLLLAGSTPGLVAAADAISSHPAVSQVLIADSHKLTGNSAEPWAELLLLVQKQCNYSHIITATSAFGKNILPRAAALLDVSSISDVVRIVDDRTFVRPMYAGNCMTTIRHKGSGPCLITIRPTSFPAIVTTSRSGLSQAPIVCLDASKLGPVTFAAEWMAKRSPPANRRELGNADVIVSGGRGLKSVENFKMLEALANKLGGAVGASRAAVDAGYVPNDMQIGQTGKIVSPTLYLAVGISGAVQHLAGIKDSKVVVAINKDSGAPIFQVADYGLVADLFEVLPELISKV